MDFNHDQKMLLLNLDAIVSIDNPEQFIMENTKLIELYKMLTRYGLDCEYEYAYHDNEKVIPAIISYGGINDELDPGLPGIAVISKNNRLYLVATSQYSGVKEAIEFENKNDDVISMVDLSDYNDGNDYFIEIFDTSSAKEMCQYLETLSSIEYRSGGYLIPLSRYRVASFWTKLLMEGSISFDRIHPYLIQSGKHFDEELDFDERYDLSHDEEQLLAKILELVKNSIKEIQSEYILML